MKIRDGFILKSVAGRNIVVPVGAQVDFNGMLTLNDTGLFFWQLLSEGISKDDMLKRVTAEYEVDVQTAAADIDAFAEKLRSRGILED